MLKAIEEYLYGIKKAMLGFYEDYLVSSLIYQDCKHLNGLTELKSGRTIKELERRFFLSFIIRQVEALSKQEGKLGMICDVRSDKLGTLNMLKIIGFKEVARGDLYNENREDAILMKSFDGNSLFYPQYL